MATGGQGRLAGARVAQSLANLGVQLSSAFGGGTATGGLTQNQINTEAAKSFNQLYKSELGSINNAATDISVFNRDPRIAKARQQLGISSPSAFHSPFDRKAIVNRANDNAKQEIVQTAQPLLGNFPEFTGSVLAIDEKEYKIQIETALITTGEEPSVEVKLTGGIEQQFKFPITQDREGIWRPSGDHPFGSLHGAKIAAMLQLGIGAPPTPGKEAVEDEQRRQMQQLNDNAKDFVGTMMEKKQLAEQLGSMHPSRRDSRQKEVTAQINSKTLRELNGKTNLGLSLVSSMLENVIDFGAVTDAKGELKFNFDSSSQQSLLELRILRENIAATKLNLVRTKAIAEQNITNMLVDIEHPESEYRAIMDNWSKAYDKDVVGAMAGVETLLTQITAGNFDEAARTREVLSDNVKKSDSIRIFSENAVKLIEAQRELSNQGAAFIKWLGPSFLQGIFSLQALGDMQNPALKAIATNGEVAFQSYIASGQEVTNLLTTVTGMNQLLAGELSGDPETQGTAAFLYHRKLLNASDQAAIQITRFAIAGAKDPKEPTTIQAQANLVMAWLQLDELQQTSDVLLANKDLDGVKSFNNLVTKTEALVKRTIDGDDETIRLMRKIYNRSSKAVPDLTNSVIKALTDRRDQLLKSSTEPDADEQISMIDKALVKLKTAQNVTITKVEELFEGGKQLLQDMGETGINWARERGLFGLTKEQPKPTTP